LFLFTFLSLFAFVVSLLFLFLLLVFFLLCFFRSKYMWLRCMLLYLFLFVFLSLFFLSFFLSLFLSIFMFFFVFFCVCLFTLSLFFSYLSIFFCFLVFFVFRFRSQGVRNVFTRCMSGVPLVKKILHQKGKSEITQPNHSELAPLQNMLPLHPTDGVPYISTRHRR
jgi:hypothetical protein